MKTLTTLVLLFTMTAAHSQRLIGAWEWSEKDANGQEIRTVVIFSDQFQVATTFDAQTGEFLFTNGGLWSIDGNVVTETVEFHTSNPEKVGTSISFAIEFLGKNKVRMPQQNIEMKRLDDGSPGALAGAWLMSGRKRNGELQERDINRPRKTMKILSGTRFQWIAYNTETRQFMGTGGGTYTTRDGKYTENIEFFSRDNAKVGLSLAFTYDLIEGKWHHSGKSSKGDPMYEIWSRREN
jgi:hypothetical protein